MRHPFPLTLIAILACAIPTASALAHAFLDRATPGVGASVNASPGELELKFSQDIVVVLSGVTIASSTGGAVQTAKATSGPANTLHVRLTRPLGAGTYVVSWHVVSIDTHPTSGKYRFTIGP